MIADFGNALSLIANAGVIVVFALVLNLLIERVKLPGLLGMMAVGILLGPSLGNFISAEVLVFSKELRTAALIVILIRAGLGIHRKTLNTIGVPAALLSLIHI